MTGKIDTSASLAPATCFAFACIAFSVVALSTFWRNDRNDVTSSTRVIGQQQQAKVSPDKCATRHRESYAIGEKQQQVGELASLSSKIAHLLRARQDTTEVRDIVTSLLGEISVVSTSLCRLQQELFSNAELLSNDPSLAPCFDAAIGSLQATLLALDGILSVNVLTRESLSGALKQLRSQHLLDFVLSSLSSAKGPPTPPAEDYVEASLGVQHISFPQVASDTNEDPNGGHKCWAEPPPEYSPPAHSGTHVQETVDSKDMAAAPASPERQDCTESGDSVYEAVSRNDNRALEGLLATGAHPSVCFGELQRTALHQAAYLNHEACLTTLLRNGSVMDTEDAKGDTAMHLAAWCGNVESLAALLRHGADTDWLSGRDAYSPLWCAINGHQIDAARLLLKHGARVSLRAASGRGLMPLHQAAVTGQSAMCELLLERGAQVNCLDDDKNMPLHHAAAAGSVPSVRVLIGSGANIEARQANGLTALHWAAHKGHAEVVSVLLDHGARIDVRVEDQGASALHLAAVRGHTAAVGVLVERGANRDVFAIGWDGACGTPIEMARKRGKSKVVKMLSK